MHLFKSLTVFGMVLPATIMAKEYLRFYNEADFKGKNQEVLIETGACRPIPDSNAKGDCGSSVSMTKNDRQDVFCKLYEGRDCKAGQQSPEIRGPGMKSFCYGKVVFRYYECYLKF